MYYYEHILKTEKVIYEIGILCMAVKKQQFLILSETEHKKKPKFELHNKHISFQSLKYQILFACSFH